MADIEDTDDRPRYRVRELSLIGNALVNEGTEINDYDGYPSGNLEPLNDAAKAKAAELVEINKQRIRDIQAANPFSATLDPEALGKAISQGIADAMAQQAVEQADQQARLAAAIEALAAGASGKAASK
jgi:hypothetical protein